MLSLWGFTIDSCTEDRVRIVTNSRVINLRATRDTQLEPNISNSVILNSSSNSKPFPVEFVLQSFTRAILNSRYFELHAFFVSPVITTQQQGSTVPVLTMTSKSACVPVKTGISIGTLTEYGLLRRTPTVGNNMTIFTFTLFILTM